MDAIKSKMQSLSQATTEATARAAMYDEEIRRINDIADKYEEQVWKFDIAGGTLNFFFSFRNSCKLYSRSGVKGWSITG